MNYVVIIHKLQQNLKVMIKDIDAEFSYTPF